MKPDPRQKPRRGTRKAIPAAVTLGLPAQSSPRGEKGESPPLPQPQPAGSAEPRQPSRGHTGEQLSPRLLTLEDAAKTLQMSTASLRRLISAGKLPAVRPTRRILLDVQDVEDFIRRSKTRAW